MYLICLYISYWFTGQNNSEKEHLWTNVEWTDCLLRTGNIFILFLDFLAWQIILCFSVDSVTVNGPFTILPVRCCENS